MSQVKGKIFRTKSRKGKFHEKWRYRIWDPTINASAGGWKTFTGYSSRKKTVEEMEAKIAEVRMAVHKAAMGETIDTKEKLKDLLHQYITWKEATGGKGGRPWSPVHRRTTVARLHWWLAKLGNVPARDITLGQIESVRVELSKKRAGKTVNHLGMALKAFFAWCVERELLAKNPLAKMTKFIAHKTFERRAYTPIELIKLFACLTPQERVWKVAYQIAVLTGFRANEIEQLRVKDVNWETGELCLDKEFAKNRKEAKAMIPDQVLTELKIVAMGRSDRQKLLPISLHNASVALNKHLRRAGIEKINEKGKVDFHAFRVTFITYVVASGADIKTAQSLARHSTPDLTIMLYAKGFDDKHLEAVQKVARVLMPASEIKSTINRKESAVKEKIGYNMVTTANPQSVSHCNITGLRTEGVGFESSESNIFDSVKSDDNRRQTPQPIKSGLARRDDDKPTTSDDTAAIQNRKNLYNLVTTRLSKAPTEILKSTLDYLELIEQTLAPKTPAVTG